MEEFRDIPGYEGFYQISDLGNVISLVRLLPSAIAAGRRTAKSSLTPFKSDKGRFRITLCKGGITKRFHLHELALAAFVGLPADKPKAKLTEQDVKAIRASNATTRALAEHYGVSQVAIHFIKTRKTWKHVP